MPTKGKVSEVGADRPTQKSQQEVDNLVSDVLGDSPAPGEGLKEAPKEEDTQGNEEATEQASTEPAEEPSETQEEPEKADEDVVPKSKHDKALERMQQRIDNLTQKLKEQEISKPEPKNQTEKLEALSFNELNELRDNVDDSIVDAKVAAKVEGVDATSRLTELRQLKRQIDDTMRNAPKRFASKQLKHLESIVSEVKEFDPDIVNKRGELWEAANRVYARMPSLQKSETGQAEAVAIAAEYILERRRLSQGREKNSELSQKVTNLKRKTSLDTKTRSVDQNQQTFKKLREKAIGGTYSDKLDFVKSLVPDEYLSP